MSTMPFYSRTIILAQDGMLVRLGGEIGGDRQNVSMTKTVKPHPKPAAPRHFIKQWREYRGHTLESLAEEIGISHGAIQQLETGKTHYRQQTLEALASALNCSPADLIMRDPTKDDGPRSLYEVWEKATAQRRRQIIRVIEALENDEAPDGTNG